MIVLLLNVWEIVILLMDHVNLLQVNVNVQKAMKVLTARKENAKIIVLVMVNVQLVANAYVI
jgi:hypothetical protein